MALVEDTGQRYVEAEIHRLEGNLLLAEKGSAEAEACYVRALEVVRAQEARSLELRAATSLARLWGERGRSAEDRRRAIVLGGSVERLARGSGSSLAVRARPRRRARQR